MAPECGTADLIFNGGRGFLCRDEGNASPLSSRSQPGPPSRFWAGKSAAGSPIPSVSEHHDLFRRLQFEVWCAPVAGEPARSERADLPYELHFCEVYG